MGTTLKRKAIASDDDKSFSQQEQEYESDTGSVFESPKPESPSEPESSSDTDTDCDDDSVNEILQEIKHLDAIYAKAPSDLTNDDIVELAARWEKKEARNKAPQIRAYLIKISQRHGQFDIEKEDFPGHFYGVTSVYPVTCSRELDPEHYAEYEDVSKLAISKYNRTYKTKFEVANVVRVNCMSSMYTTYFLTFNAVDLKLGQSNKPTLFHAVVAAYNVNRQEKKIIRSCKKRADE